MGLHLQILGYLCLTAFSVMGAPGDVDQTFATQNVEGIYAFAYGNNNQIIIGGSFTNLNSTGINRLARLNSDGTVDTSFNSGSGPNGFVSGIARQTDGKIIIAGAFTSVNGVSRSKVARLNDNGEIDQDFTLANGIFGTLTRFNNVTIQNDGKILIGGLFSTTFGSIKSIKNGIVRLNTDGTLDTNFLNGVTGVETFPAGGGEVMAVKILSDGRILIGGFFFTVNGIQRNALALLNPDGTLDASFDLKLPISSPPSTVRSIDLQSNNTVLVSGSFTTVNGIPRVGIVRLHLDGTVDSTFYPGSGPNLEVKTLSLAGNGKIIIGGDFTSYDGVPRNHLARLNGDGSIDQTFIASANDAVSYSINLPNNRTFIAGAFTNIDATEQRGSAVLLGGDGPPLAPTIVTQCQDAQFAAGGVGLLRVAANGTPLNFQWFHNDVAVSGATNSHLEFSNVTTNDAGNYCVVITNSSGSVTSRVAFVTVTETFPQITAGPQSISTPEGATAQFIATVTSAPPAEIQWFFNGQPVTGATEDRLKIININSAHAGSYSIIASNYLGSVTSSPVMLTVLPRLSIGDALDNSNLTFTVGGDAQWFGQLAQTHDGIDAAQSGVLADGQQAWIETTLVGEGTLKFWWKVSSGFGDHFRYQNVSSTGGITEWAQSTYTFGPGSRVVRWTYVKDAALSRNEDTAWLDQVQFIQNPPNAPHCEPNTTFTNGSARITLLADASRTYWLQYSTNLTDWVSWTNFASTTTSNWTFIDPDATNRVQKFYRAVWNP